MRKNAPDITHESLTKLLDYNKHTGLLTWRITRSRLAREHDEAGTFAHDGTIIVGVQGRTYAASRLIWFYVRGYWPVGRLRFKDGDPTNLRWNNIYEEDARLSQKHINIYQRKRRKLIKLATEKIQADPALQHAYVTAPSPDAVRRLIKAVASDIEENMERNDISLASRPAVDPHIRRVRHGRPSRT